MGNDWLSALTAILADVVSDNGELFASLGTRLTFALGCILFVMFGAKCAIEGRGMDWSGMIRLFMLVATAAAMMKFYSSSAGFLGGKTFPQLLIEGPQYLANQIGVSQFKELNNAFETLTKNNPPGIMHDLTLNFSYWVLRSLMEICRAVLFIIMSYGFIAQAVCVIVGPVFIPFVLFEPMAFMFWGWFKCMLQYSFYPVIVALYSKVFGTFLLNLISDQTDFTTAMSLIPYILVFIVGMASAPGLVRSLFSGSSTSGGGMAALASKALPFK